MPATAVSLRVLPIHEVDLEPVAALVNRAFATYSEMFKGQRTSAADYADEAGDQARVLLVEDGCTLVATGMIAAAERFVAPDQLGPAGTKRPGITTAAQDHPWSGALYFGLAGVEPALMNGGFGRMIVKQAELIAAEEGHLKLALGTVREFGLVEYYEKLNYTVFHEDEYPPGHWDFVVPHHYCEMVKHL
jgi:GNAT superfamily N-acetyltransferase